MVKFRFKLPPPPGAMMITFVYNKNIICSIAHKNVGDSLAPYQPFEQRHDIIYYFHCSINTLCTL